MAVREEKKVREAAGQFANYMDQVRTLVLDVTTSSLLFEKEGSFF
jgi:hypothetical protein